MQKRGYVYPRIAEEIVDIAELRQVWQCGYMTVNRIMYGRKIPNHIQKERLSEYLGIPINELFIQLDEDGNVIPDKWAEIVPSKVQAKDEKVNEKFPSDENSEII